MDYSGTGLNSGSKVVFAAYGDVKRSLCTSIPSVLHELQGFQAPALCMPGVVALRAEAFTDYEAAGKQMEELNFQLKEKLTQLEGVAMIVITDDPAFTAAKMNNYVWVTYTRCNPSHDIYGIDAFTSFKHWGCNGPLVIDARIKPHHAPALVKDPEVEKKIDRLFEKGKSLHGVLK